MNIFTTQCFVVVAALLMLLLLLLLLLRTRQIVSSCFVEFVHFVLLPLLCSAVPCFVRCSRLLASFAHFKLPVVCGTTPLFISSALSTQWLRCSLCISLSCSGCCALALSRALPLARALILIWCLALLVCLDCSRFGVFCFGIFVDIVSFVPKKKE